MVWLWLLLLHVCPMWANATDECGLDGIISSYGLNIEGRHLSHLCVRLQNIDLEREAVSLGLKSQEQLRDFQDGLKRFSQILKYDEARLEDYAQKVAPLWRIMCIKSIRPYLKDMNEVLTMLLAGVSKDACVEQAFILLEMGCENVSELRWADLSEFSWDLEAISDSWVDGVTVADRIIWNWVDMINLTPVLCRPYMQQYIAQSFQGYAGRSQLSFLKEVAGCLPSNRQHFSSLIVSVYARYSHPWKSALEADQEVTHAQITDALMGMVSVCESAIGDVQRHCYLGSVLQAVLPFIQSAQTLSRGYVRDIWHILTPISCAGGAELSSQMHSMVNNIWGILRRDLSACDLQKVVAEALRIQTEKWKKTIRFWEKVESLDRCEVEVIQQELADFVMCAQHCGMNVQRSIVRAHERFKQILEKEHIYFYGVESLLSEAEEACDSLIGYFKKHGSRTWKHLCKPHAVRRDIVVFPHSPPIGQKYRGQSRDLFSKRQMQNTNPWIKVPALGVLALFEILFGVR